MNRYCQIIWDWNGTLLDDAWLCVDIINNMLTKRDLKNLDIETYKNIFDFPVQVYYERAGFDFSLEPFAATATEFCNEYLRRVGECHLHDGAKEILEKIRNAGIHQSILSATEQLQLDEVVKSFGISTMFKDIIGQSNNHAIGKAQKAKELVDALDDARGKILLIGDTTHDFCIAKDVNIDSILVSIGHHSRKKLKTVDEKIFDSLAELEHLIINKKMHNKVGAVDIATRCN